MDTLWISTVFLRVETLEMVIDTGEIGEITIGTFVCLRKFFIP